MYTPQHYYHITLTKNKLRILF